MNIFKTTWLFTAILAVISCGSRDRYITLQGYAQGGTYSIKLNLKGEDGMIRVRPEKIHHAIDSILYSIDTTLSGYNKGSLLSRFNAGEEIPLTPMFEDIYSRAYGYWKETEGALDVAAAPLFDVWGFGFTTDSLPSDRKIQEALTICGMKRLQEDIRDAAQLTSQQETISAMKLLTEEAVKYFNGAYSYLVSVEGEPLVPVKLNFNAIAQGYSCDVVAAYLYGLGVKDMLVDIGEIYCDGVNPSGMPWRVGVDRPVDGNNSPGADLDGIWEASKVPCGIVTSGNYRKFYVKNGKKYAHTIDPRTGYPVEHNLLSATIVAHDATDADAYATCCMVIGFEAAKEFIESRPDDIAGYLIYTDEDGLMHEWASENFNIVED